MGFLSKLFGKKKDDSKARIDIREFAKEQKSKRSWSVKIIRHDFAIPSEL